MGPKSEERLQVLILLDIEDKINHTNDKRRHFVETFEPLNVSRHKCLIPMLNMPMIEYTLEWLSSSRCINEIVFYGYEDSVIDVRRYLLSSTRWKDSLCVSGTSSSNIHSCGDSMLSLKFVTGSRDVVTLGDALREVDAKHVISGDFLLIRSHGCVVSNIDIGGVWEEHKKLCNANKTIIMTSLFRQLGSNHTKRSKLNHSVVQLNQHNKILACDDLPMIEFMNRYVDGDKEYIVDNSNIRVHVGEDDGNIRVHYDLMSCGVELCSQRVLTLLTENFDYQNLYQDFLEGINTSEILMCSFFCMVLDGDCDYLSNVSSLFYYDSTSKDLVDRWAYPVTLEHNVFDPISNRYILNDHNQYISNTSTSISDKSKLLSRIVVGSYTTIEDGVVVEDSVIGHNVVIKNGARIYNSYIFDNVVVDINAVVNNSMVGDGVNVGNDAIVHEGCTIGCGVHIKSHSEVMPYSLLVSKSTVQDLVDENTLQYQIRLETNPCLEGNVEKTRSLCCDITSNGIYWTPSFSREWRREKSMADEEGLEVAVNNRSLLEEDTLEMHSPYSIQNLYLVFSHFSISKSYAEVYKDVEKFLCFNAYHPQLSCTTETPVSSNPQSTCESEGDLEYIMKDLDIMSPSERSRRSSTACLIYGISDMLKNAIDRSISIDRDVSPDQYKKEQIVSQTVLEIHALKMSCNSDREKVANIIYPIFVRCLMEYRDNEHQIEGGVSDEQMVNHIFGTWAELFNKFKRHNNTEDDFLILDMLAKEMSHMDIKVGKDVFPWIVMCLYQKEVLDEDNIVDWWEAEDSVYKTTLNSLIEWFKVES